MEALLREGENTKETDTEIERESRRGEEKFKKTEGGGGGGEGCFLPHSPVSSPNIHNTFNMFHSFSFNAVSHPSRHASSTRPLSKQPEPESHCLPSPCYSMQLSSQFPS